MRQMKGSIVMLNLLRFRAIADYSATPDLAPDTTISGAAAFQKYIEHTLESLLVQKLAKLTGKSIKTIEKDIAEDHFMSPQEAVRYGLIDKVIEREEK